MLITGILISLHRIFAPMVFSFVILEAFYPLVQFILYLSELLSVRFHLSFPGGECSWENYILLLKIVSFPTRYGT